MVELACESTASSDTRTAASPPDPTAPAPLAPFGTHTLAPWREALRAFGVQLVPRHYPRLGSILNWPIWRLSLLGRPGPVDLEPFPHFRMRLYPRENHADTKCYARAALCDLPEEEAIARCVEACSDGEAYCVDVGANTGTYTVLFAALARAAGVAPKLTCIEANPKTQLRLLANLRFSALEGHARVFGVAVSDAPGKVMLDTAKWNLGSVKVTGKASPFKRAGVQTVPARTLLSVVEDAGLPRIDFLKIDIEGHEVQALKPFFEHASPHLLPRMILAETKHDRGAALSSLLHAAGYRATLFGRSDTVFERAV